MTPAQPTHTPSLSLTSIFLCPCGAAESSLRPLSLLFDVPPPHPTHFSCPLIHSHLFNHFTFDYPSHCPSPFTTPAWFFFSVLVVVDVKRVREKSFPLILSFFFLASKVLQFFFSILKQLTFYSSLSIFFFDTRCNIHLLDLLRPLLS